MPTALFSDITPIVLEMHESTLAVLSIRSIALTPISISLEFQTIYSMIILVFGIE
jgi:hypothetical protein